MIQKIVITISLILTFLLILRLIKKINNFKQMKASTRKKEDDLVDLEKDPVTNEYKPKQ
jgi:hypothetical protein